MDLLANPVSLKLTLFNLNKKQGCLLIFYCSVLGMDGSPGPKGKQGEPGLGSPGEPGEMGLAGLPGKTGEYILLTEI